LNKSLITHPSTCSDVPFLAVRIKLANLLLWFESDWTFLASCQRWSPCQITSRHRWSRGEQRGTGIERTKPWWANFESWCLKRLM